MSERYLDFQGVTDKLAEIGVTRSDGSPIPVDTIRTWADKGRLPFFKAPNNRRLISERVLLEAFRKLQEEALKPPPKSRLR